MHGFRNAFAFTFITVAGLSIASALGPMTRGKAIRVPYSTVAPIFKNCAICHSGPHPKHFLNLTSYANVMKGDKEGKVVIPGSPVSSRLSMAVHRKGAAAMPPNAALPPKDVAKIDAWIKAGAKEK
jgi:hypothetical protein